MTHVYSARTMYLLICTSEENLVYVPRVRTTVYAGPAWYVLPGLVRTTYASGCGIVNRTLPES